MNTLEKALEEYLAMRRALAIDLAMSDMAMFQQVCGARAQL
jgi:hypothetical protein